MTRYVRGGEEIDNFHTIGMRRGIPVTRLTADMRRLIPREQLPITAGRIHFMRKVDHTGQIAFLNETWPVGPQWVGEYVRATVDTAQQTLTVWHQADAYAYYDTEQPFKVGTQQRETSGCATCIRPTAAHLVWHEAAQGGSRGTGPVGSSRARKGLTE
jgi:hypothetical protein